MLLKNNINVLKNIILTQKKSRQKNLYYPNCMKLCKSKFYKYRCTTNQQYFAVRGQRWQFLRKRRRYSEGYRNILCFDCGSNWSGYMFVKAH